MVLYRAGRIRRGTIKTLRLLATLALILMAATAARGEAWDDTLAEARGQAVFWNAWGGDEHINDYIAWVGDQVRARYGIELNQVKLTDTAEAVARVVAEKAAGREDGGSVDLIWINGENFAAMKANKLLFGPFVAGAAQLPLRRYQGQAHHSGRFHGPDGWPRGPLGHGAVRVFLRHGHGRRAAAVDPGAARLGEAPSRSLHLPGAAELPRLDLPEAGAARADAMIRPSCNARSTEADFAAATEPLWRWLEEIRPYLWRQGQSFPASGPALHQLLDDGEVDFSMAFNPAEASNAISAGQLPETVRSFILEGGTIGNTHFVAIPFNAAHKAAAMVVADFLMSPEAQARKQDPRVWGDGTVLDLAALGPADRARFAALPQGIATLSPEQLIPVRPEPHPSWMVKIEAEWLRRFSS